RIVGRLLVSFAALLFASTSAISQNSPADSPAAAHMRSLNNSLLHLHGQLQHADPTSARMLRGQAATVISQRWTTLGNLIQTDPRKALSFAFSPELLTEMASKFPQSAAQLESHSTMTGSVEHWIADGPGFKTSRSIWHMNAGGRTLN